MCTIEWQVPLELSPAPLRSSDKGLWIDPVTFITLLNGWELAQCPIQTSQQPQFWILPKAVGPGAPETYRDESVLLTSLVAAAWRLSNELIVEWLARYDALAEAPGYHQFDRSAKCMATIRRPVNISRRSARPDRQPGLREPLPLCSCSTPHREPSESRRRTEIRIPRPPVG